MNRYKLVLGILGPITTFLGAFLMLIASSIASSYFEKSIVIVGVFVLVLLGVTLLGKGVWMFYEGVSSE
jgi:hypothetical protein